jgi:hypothetical protein
MDEHVEVGMLKVHMAMMKSPTLPQNRCRDYGTNDVCGGGVWGLGQLKDYSTLH